MTHASADVSSWWSALSHGGLLIAPSRLSEHFPEPAPYIDSWTEEKLRSALDRLDARGKGAEAELLDRTLEGALGLGREHHLETGIWEKGSSLGSEYGHRDATGAVIKPRRLWRGTSRDSLPTSRAELPVFFDDAERIGVHRGRRAHARVVEWLRGMDRRLALLTNGRQWRLIHVGLDSDSWAESDSARWFEEGGEGEALRGLRTLLSPSTLIPEQEGATSRLVAAIEATRRGQSELSSSLGENVRKAVELLIASHGAALTDLLAREAQDSVPGEARPVRSQDLYVAACRMVMRLVVLHFAEAREGLLPTDRATYREAYSLEGLRTQLERAAGSSAKGRMKERTSAWPRLLALFRLIASGSTHPDLPIPRYGGGLFAAGGPRDRDPVSRAMAILETACFQGDDRARVSDAHVHEILRLLTRSRIKVRQGNRRTTVVAPVDFSDLSSEYIGILYEGLLDFELRTVEGEAPVVFLDLGDQPALALESLERMEPKAIASLVEKLGKPSKQEVSEDEDGGDDSEEEEEDADQMNPEEGEDAAAEDEPPEEEPESAEEEADDVRGEARARATRWARTAVEAGRLVRKSTSKDPAKIREREQKVDALAERLIARTILPGEWYLVRFGGTRKGAGTYYTKPELAIPTVQRTLRPLCYDPPAGADGQLDTDAPTADWVPKAPEVILALKVCDPACGSGSFLVAALRFLTDALYRSLQHHGRVAEQGDGSVVRLADGESSLRLEDELLPCRPEDEEFEARLRARLRRHVVERCIHGVDIDPLAVELCRLSLWVETLDRNLPFTFLDHRVKCGNALVGCWLDRYEDYPILAWEREGGDRTHSVGKLVAKEEWTKAIRAMRTGEVKRNLVEVILGQGVLDFDSAPHDALRIQAELESCIAEIHTLPVQETEAREAKYSRSYESLAAPLRRSLDLWTAVWFWPAQEISAAPLPSEMKQPRKETRAVLDRLRERLRFFHWELEFPDVFTRNRDGFDAVVGNPPWENLQANPEEYFSNYDPAFRSYGRSQKSACMQEYFELSGDNEIDWLEYCAEFKAYANWSRNAGRPFGDPQAGTVEFRTGSSKRSGTKTIHRKWRGTRASRQGLADPEHPFTRQGGGRVFTYKLFLELAYATIRSSSSSPPATGGRFGMLTPASIYTDKGSQELRRLFLDQCSWEWLFSFENRNKVFDIHRSFKFCALIAAKGGRTDAIRAAFMRHDVEEWSTGAEVSAPYSRAQVDRFSPKSHALLEVSGTKDLKLLEKIYANAAPLGQGSEGGWGAEFALEFMMNTDAKLFPPRQKWEAKGYEPDEYSRWLLTEWHPRTSSSPAPPGAPRHALEPGIILSRSGDQWVHTEEIRDMALPFYQGVMVQIYDPRPKAYVAGGGSRASWDDLGPESAYLHPQFLMARETYRTASSAHHGFKVGFRDISNATNQRTFITTLLPDLPAGNVLGTLRTRSDENAVDLITTLGSLAFDWAVRRRMGGTHLNWFIVEELPGFRVLGSRVREIALRLAGVLPHFSSLALKFVDDDIKQRLSWARLLARSSHERVRLRCILDAIAFASAGLNDADVQHTLSGCDLPLERLEVPSDPRGFWRVDKNLEPELRHTVLAQVAFSDLQADIRAAGGELKSGIEAFLDRNNGEGWFLPEALRLTEYDLGRDERSRHPQPVATRLGPRFYDWQLAQTPEESWRECELHAANLNYGACPTPP